MSPLEYVLFFSLNRSLRINLYFFIISLNLIAALRKYSAYQNIWMFYKEIKKKSQTAFHEILSVVELKLKKTKQVDLFFLFKVPGLYTKRIEWAAQDSGSWETNSFGSKGKINVVSTLLFLLFSRPSSM